MFTDKSLDSVFYRGGRGSVGTIVHGSGVRITDSDGREYIDAMGGVAVQIVGHGNPSIGAAMAEAAKDYAYTYSQTFTTRHQKNLAERLTTRLSIPEGAAYYFASGGSEANEVAMKFARQYHMVRGNPEKYKVIRRAHAYHGNTMGTLSVSDRPSWRQDYDPYLFNSPRVSGWRTARELQAAGGQDDILTARALDELERVIWSEGPRTISAMIIEPVSGSSVAGAETPLGYLKGVRELCDEHDILLISDEVFVGYGRLGAPRATPLFGIEPDILVLGKGLGSGYAPLSSVVLFPEIFSVLGGPSGRHQQGYTFSGLPMSCAVGVAVSDYIEEHQLFAAAAERGASLHRKLREALKESAYVGDIRGRGMLVGIEFVEDKASLKPFPEELQIAGRVTQGCRDRGVILSPGSPQIDDFHGGDQIHLAPPFVTSEEDVDLIVSAIRDSVTDTMSSVG
ncbi:MAG: aspartate aminotransferase family protein [Brooklawnia sp.]|jgi:adenosylmethionine-8-amino-7-oxononanoate aminotransferase